MSTQPEHALWALLPVKGFARGKSRLGGVLSDPVRTAFARGLFEHVLATLLGTDGIATVLVLTEDDKVAALAGQHGAEVLRDPPVPSLATIIDAGLALAARQGARAAIVCMADLPHVSVAELTQVVAALREHPVVLVPDAAGEGTNLLGLAPPGRFASCFGRADSYAQHLARAREHGIEPHVIRTQGLCFDVDGPEELEQLEP